MTHLQERDFSADERKKLAKSGAAMPDGSFPIVDKASLQAAIHLAGHASDPAAARRHIKKRAAALGLSNLIPDSWKESHMTDTITGTHLVENELLEAVTRPVDQTDGRHIAEVTLIHTGLSKMGNNYSHQALRESVPLFEGARAFTDHDRSGALPERSIRDLVGYYKNVSFDGSAVRGELHLIPGNEWLFNLLQEAEGNPKLCGLSIDAYGDKNEATGEVRSIDILQSIDIVTRPSAGGMVNRILASEIPPTTPQENHMDPTQAPEQPNPAESPPAAGVGTAAPSLSAPTQLQESSPPANKDAAPDLAQLLEQLKSERDHARTELEHVQGILAPSAPSAPDHLTEVHKLVEELKRDRDLTRASALLDAKLTEAALPQPVADKIRRQYAGRLVESSLLDTTIAEEKTMLAALTSAGQIAGMGYEKHVTVGMSEYDQLQAAFDGLFDIYESEAAKSIPRLSGIREAFRIATGVDPGQVGGVDRPLLESFANGLRQKVRSGHLTESEVLLREADVTTATFSYLLGTSMNKRLLSDYMAWPSEWQKFTTIVGIKDFKQQDRIRLGAFGSLSTVAEDAAYTTLTVSDTRAIYTATKRGNLVQVTRETIINDDLYSIKQIPQKLAVAAAFTLAEFVYNLLAPNFGNIYDAHPLFDSVNHLNTGVTSGNLGTANSGTALSSAALQTAVIGMRKQKNLASKPIGLKPRYLLVPPDLEFSAMTILKSAGLPGGNNNDINPMMGYAEPIIAPQLNNLNAGPASTTVWIAVADPRVIDTVEVGFVGGQANPVLLIQDMPLYGLNFTQDTISYKVRHEYGGAVVDYRGFYLGNN